MKRNMLFTIGKLRSRKLFCRMVAGVSSFLMLTTTAAPALAAGMSVLGGDATLTDATRASLNKGSATDSYAQFVADTGAKSAVLDWSKFNIGANKEMNFSGAGTTFFNLVNSGTSKSQINGIISSSSSDNVWVINPAGIAFGVGAQVNVGGIFVAAAGNLSNAEALKDGSATLPTFDSFSGQISTESGSTFVADRVALLGKGVTIDGADMKRVGQLAIGAASGMTVVDDVANGKVKIDVTEFASDSSMTSVELGDLDLGGGVDLGLGVNVAERGLYVRSGNGVKVTGKVSTDGNVEVYTKNGDITVEDTGRIHANGIASDVSLVTGMGENVKGDIVVNGSVKADSEQGFGYETVYAYAGYGNDDARSVGNVEINGTVKASGNLDVRSWGDDGSIEIGESGAVISRQEDVKLFAGSSVKNAGAVAAGNGFVYATGHSDGVNLNVESGLVVAQAVCAQTDADAPVIVNNPKNIITDLDASRANSSSQADFAADMYGLAIDQTMYKLLCNYLGGSYSGNIVVWDDVVDSDTFSLSSTFGDITVLNGVTLSSGTGQLWLRASGSIYTGKTSALLSSDYVNIYAGGTTKSSLLGTMDVGSIDIFTFGDVELGNITARSYNLFSDDLTGDGVADPISIGVTTLAGDISVQSGAKITATDEQGAVYLTSAKSIDVAMGSEIIANGANGAVSVAVVGASGDSKVVINGTVEATDMAQVAGVGGDVAIGETGSVRGGKTSYVGAISGSVTVNGRVESDDTAFVSGKKNLDINGTVRGEKIAYLESDDGDIVIKGRLAADGDEGYANINCGGDIIFSSSGSLCSKGMAAVVAKGNLIQKDALQPYRDGWMNSMFLRPSISGEKIVLEIGRAIGGGINNPLVVDGKLWVISFGDMFLAVGNGQPLQGGDASSVSAARDSVQYTVGSARKMIDGTLTLDDVNARVERYTEMNADFDDNALLYAAGDMYLYTAGQLEANSYVGAGKNMTVSAASFGDMSYLQAGGELTINNVGKPAYPQIAYFESVDGVEPKINNQPNDTVIFVDGRLAGGNLKILNQFGANEAFLVATPELKSTQGIFGNPLFLHSDLDVANPMEVGAIDYMLQETPRLTLDKEFPQEVDQHVDSVVIPEKDSIQFGRGVKDESNDREAEGKVAVTGPLNGHVAMIR